MFTPQINPKTHAHSVAKVTRRISEFRETIPQARAVFRSSQRQLNRSIHEVLNADSHDIVARIKFKKILNHCLKDIMQPENFLNNGRESKVYQIDNEYVARIKRGKSAKSAIPFYSYPSRPNVKFNEIDCYYGEPIIKVGNVEILKNATPTKDSISCGAEFKEYLSEDDIKSYYGDYLPRCSLLPQESFDELAEGLSKLNKVMKKKMFNQTYFMPDTINPNNILISDNRFRLVDKLDPTPSKNPNSIYTILEPLLIKFNPNILATENAEYTDIRKNIFKKIILAANKHNLPMNSRMKDPYADHTLNRILQMPCGTLLEDVNTMMKNGVPVSERESFIEEFMAKDHTFCH